MREIYAKLDENFRRHRRKAQKSAVQGLRRIDCGRKNNNPPRLYEDGGASLFPFMISKNWANAFPENYQKIQGSSKTLRKNNPVWYDSPEEDSLDEEL